MTFNDFRDKMKDMILEYGQFTDCEFEYNEVTKNNGLRLQGIMIKNDIGLSPVIYINDFYDDYSAGMDMEDIKAHLYKMLDGVVDGMAKQNAYFNLTENLTNLDFCRNIIYMKLINADMNKHITAPDSDIPYVRYDDLGLISIFQISMEKYNRMNSVMVNKSLLNTWGINEEGLEKIAKENLERDRPIHIDPMENVLSNFMKRCSDEMPEEILAGLENARLDMPMYVVTNSTLFHGAQTMMYPDFISKVQQATGFDKFMILPSSIHELIIVPYVAPYAENAKITNGILDLVPTVNREQLNHDEILSDNVFYCDGTKISIAS